MCASKPQGAAAYVESSLLRLTAVDFDILRLPVVVFYTLSPAGGGRPRQAAASRGRPRQAVAGRRGRGRPWQAVAGRGRPWQAVAGRGRPWQAVGSPTFQCVLMHLLEYNL